MGKRGKYDPSMDGHRDKFDPAACKPQRGKHTAIDPEDFDDSPHNEISYEAEADE